MDLTKKQKQILAIARAKKARAEAESDSSAVDDIRGGVGTYLKGALLDWGDEIVGAGRVLAEKALPQNDIFADDPSIIKPDRGWRDDYKMYRDEERELQRKWADEQGGWGTALELAGGIASPVNVIGPLQQARQGANFLTAAGQTGLRSAAEGALTGAGAAEEMEDIPEYAERGAKFGGVLGGTMGGVSRLFGNRRIAQELGKGDDFTPIHMVDTNTGVERGLRSTYRNILGRLPGTKGVLEKQQRGIIEAAEKNADEAAKVARDTNRYIDYIEDRFKAKTTKRLQKAKQRLDDELVEAQAAMRSQQAAKSLPDYVPDDARIALASEPNPQVVAKELDRFYKEDAFSYINDQMFELDESLLRRIKHLGIDEEELAKKFGVEDIDDLLGKHISGRSLMKLRNDPAVAANVAGLRGNQWTNWHLRDGVDSFDNYLEKSLLDTSSAKRFAADKAAYGQYKAYVNAVDAADALDGKFTGEHLAKQGFKRQRRYGEAPAQELGAPVRRMERSLAKRKAKLASESEKVAKDPHRKRAIKRSKDEATDTAKHASDAASEMKKRGLQEEVTFPSQIATTAALGGFGYANPLSVPAILVGGRLAGTEVGQRFVAGQTPIQKVFQEGMENPNWTPKSEDMRLLIQLLRQGLVKQATGE